MKIGLIGLANLGTGMANNILDKINNKSDLYVYTRTIKKIKKPYQFSNTVLQEIYRRIYPERLKLIKIDIIYEYNDLYSFSY
mgnify:CR=1 FL=1|tara:strand:- start:1399 stop:1644 length:246 start_codon:yes stop_codon:yes gene_type:complete